LVEGIDPLHGDHAAATRDGMLRLLDEIGKVGEGARDNRVEGLRRLPLLDALAHDVDVVEAELDARLLEERALLVARVEERHAGPGPGDRDRDARKAGSGA